MELGSIVEFLENKSIMVTGSTGFLAKVFIEKILRVQPNVKKLYLLVRASNAESAKLRFQNEVLAKELFTVLKEKWGPRLNSYISEKITFVPGDLLSEDFGIKDSNLKEKLRSELDVIVNSAATTKFDERYDVALGVNTLGAKHLVEFAKKCVKLKVVVHVSTAYVSGETKGLISESLLDIGTSEVDIDTEMKVVEKEMNELKAKGATQNEICVSMKNLGIQRARMHGWPNTYVFTKVMGETLMQQSKGNLSVATVRPTVVVSTYKDPFPGWNDEEMRTINCIIAGSAQGRLPCLVGETKTILDLIPADMVVNAMIVAMVAHAKLPSSGSKIYHVGSSLRNPVTLENLLDCGVDYFSKKPWINQHGRPVKVDIVKLFSSLASFRSYMEIRYLLPLKVLRLANKMFRPHFQDLYKELNRKIKFTMLVAEPYSPFLSFNAIFDDTNTEKLRIAARGSQTESDLFCFDPDSIDWGDYFMNTHIPGIDKMIQPNRIFPATTKPFGGKHLPADKTITAAVTPSTFIKTSSHGNALGKRIVARPNCIYKSVLGVYAL